MRQIQLDVSSPKNNLPITDYGNSCAFSPAKHRKNGTLFFSSAEKSRRLFFSCKKSICDRFCHSWLAQQSNWNCAAAAKKAFATAVDAKIAIFKNFLSSCLFWYCMRRLTHSCCAPLNRLTFLSVFLFQQKIIFFFNF